MNAVWKSIAATAVVFTAVSQMTMVCAQTMANVTLRDGQISPRQISATKGVEVRISVRNSGKQIHNFIIPDFYIFTQNLNPGEQVDVSFVPDKIGSFRYYSDKKGIPEPGMKGTLSVSKGS